MRRAGKRAAPAIAAAVAATAVLCVTSSVLQVDGAATKREAELTTQLSNGFTAAHAAGAAAAFEPVLYAPSGAFAFGFLRVGGTASPSLDVAVVHLPSSFPVWRAAARARLGSWSRPATLTFDNGDRGLVLNDDEGVLWRTPLDAVGGGDVVELLDSSNLVVRRYDEKTTVPPEWESFNHPSDTLVLGQNFTSSTPPLVSVNRRFALRLGKTYMALHMEFEFYGGGTTPSPVYWKHTALEAHPENATVYGRLDARGFFGLYQLDGGGGGEERVDVLSFDTFVQNLTAGAFRRMTLDDDGNLRAYYWAATSSTKAWTSDYSAISERCDLPTPCGAYGLCVPGKATECQCLDDTSTSATTAASPCHAEETAADLCAGHTGKQSLDGFDVVRRNRVSVAYKEELVLETNRTVEECEAACAGNCSCWAALHSGGGGGGGSGYCYLIDFPVMTMVYEADDRKVGYFKVRRKPPPPAAARRTGAALSLLVLLVGLAVAGACVGGYQIRKRRKRRRAGMEQELVPAGPYKDLKSMDDSSNDSFRA